ncbi:MAG: PEP-CTERM sorting domain-containing protein [Planctomycetota bacterium]|jgi:hypothetical protein
MKSLILALGATALLATTAFAELSLLSASGYSGDLVPVGSEMIAIDIVGAGGQSSANAGASVITPGDFGTAAKVEDFEELANIVFTETIPGNANRHYAVPDDYWFNGDVILSAPHTSSARIGDFTQGTRFWGLGHRVIESAADVHSGSAYFGVQFNDPDTVTFTFDTAQLRVGAWVDAFWDYPVTLSVLDVHGSQIGSVSAEPRDWTFLGLESETPIWGVSVWGMVPVIDDLTYEVPEPATLLLLGLGGLSLLQRSRKM